MSGRRRRQRSRGKVPREHAADASMVTDALDPRWATETRERAWRAFNAVWEEALANARAVDERSRCATSRLEMDLDGGDGDGDEMSDEAMEGCCESVAAVVSAYVISLDKGIECLPLEGRASQRAFAAWACEAVSQYSARLASVVVPVLRRAATGVTSVEMDRANRIARECALAVGKDAAAAAAEMAKKEEGLAEGSLVEEAYCAAQWAAEAAIAATSDPPQAMAAVHCASASIEHAANVKEGRDFRRRARIRLASYLATQRAAEQDKIDER